MSEPSFRAFLEQSLRALAEECPRAYRAMSDALGVTCVRVCVGVDDFGLRSARGRVMTGPTPETATVEVVTDRTAVLDVIGARRSLLEAVAEDRLFLRGSPAELLRFHDALQAYVAGAVRSRSFPSLLSRYAATPVAGDELARREVA